MCDSQGSRQTVFCECVCDFQVSKRSVLCEYVCVILKRHTGDDERLENLLSPPAREMLKPLLKPLLKLY